MPYNPSASSLVKAAIFTLSITSPIGSYMMRAPAEDLVIAAIRTYNYNLLLYYTSCSHLYVETWTSISICAYIC